MSALSDQVLSVATIYLGPAAATFLGRQTKFHMNGLDFTNLEKSHLPELARWVEVSAKLLMDATRATELSQKISSL